MVKPKQKQLVKTSANKNNIPSSPEVDLPGGDSWVIVKKQKVTILIPPLPVTKQCAMPNAEENQPQPRTKKTINRQSDCPIIPEPQVDPPFEMENSMPTDTEKAIPTAPIAPSPQAITIFSNIPKLDYRNISENPEADNSKSRRLLGVCSASKARKGCRRFINGDLFLNPGLRALNLERKLQRAGGLSSWLMSLGLDQFVRIFQGKRVGKFQLVNLTMQKLKDMGADAVGPRRKLIHAIDCLCQPYCFEVI